MPEIGATLREARMRARIDVSEIEAQTKIRAKYLRALENEEWGLLPGPTFVKSFLRTYAQALGLDGKALVEEYRMHHEDGDAVLEPIVSTPKRTPPRARAGRTSSRPGSDTGPSRGYMLAVSAIGLVIVVLVVLLVTSGGSSPKSPTSSPSSSTRAKNHASALKTRHLGTHANGLVALSLQPSAVVYVCLLGDDGRKLIPGIELQPGEDTPTYHARRFLLTLGNSAVTVVIDGIPRTVPASSEAIGYSITKAYGRHRLTAGQEPTCT
jgi:cytoskeleton protein RodZ